MSASPSGFQWAAVVCSCAVATLLMGHPAALPDPVRSGVERAVDDTAMAWLWAWGEDAARLDPNADEWRIFEPGQGSAGAGEGSARIAPEGESREPHRSRDALQESTRASGSHTGAKPRSGAERPFLSFVMTLRQIPARVF